MSYLISLVLCLDCARWHETVQTQLSVFLAGILLYILIRPFKTNQNLKFSPNAAGLKADSLNYSHSAKNVATGIANSDSYVTVVGIYGEMGHGKSSFARMVIEHLNQSHAILYSYISLTEANEAKDFSKLFSDRWCESLGEKYPKINTLTGMALTSTMLRESNQGLISELINFIPKLDIVPIKTRTKIQDQSLSPSVFVQKDVAKSFGNIPEFKEDMWVVMIDEIERSSLEEIYRVIEVIERFKIEGASGLPLKIVFILCISSNFEKLLIEHKKKDKSFESAQLIEDFFVNDPKSITQKIALPPIDSKIMRTFIVKELLRFKKEHKIEGLPKEDVLIDYARHEPSKEFLSEKEAVEFILNLISYESPRLLFRCLQEVEFFYSSYRNSDGVLKKDDVRFCDILALSYIKLNHFYIIEFFRKTVDKLLPKQDLDAYDLIEYMNLRKSTEKRLFAWVQEVTATSSPIDGKLCENLIGLVAHFYIDFMKEKSEAEKALIYEGTTSDPTKLKQYLLLAADKVSNPNKIPLQIFQEHEKGDAEVVRKLSNEDLIRYSRFIRSIKNSRTELSLHIVEEIYRRLISFQIPVEPRIVKSDTARDEAIYQFSFKILEIMEKQRTDRTLKEDTKSAIALFKKFLLSDEIEVGAKYRVINSFVNSERTQSSSDINFRLVLAFEKMENYDKDGVHSAIKNAMEDFRKKYVEGNQDIYEKEDNFFYVLYQSWSGNAADISDIEGIQKVAQKDLYKYPDAIALYWGKYPYLGDNKSYEETVEDSYHMFTNSEGTDLLVPLKKLIEISEKADIANFELKQKISYWKRLSQNEEEYKRYLQRGVIRNDNTLKGFLTRSKIIGG